MSKTIDYSIVAASSGSQEFLWLALYYAGHMDEEPDIPAESAKTKSAKTNPALMPYVAGWGDNAGEIGLIAKLPNGSTIGAAWLRLMPADWPLYRHVDRNTPELAIAVLPNYIGRGIGGRLLSGLIEAAHGSFPGIVLSVRENNPAKRLYERFGFRTVGTITNRVGGTSFVMKLDFS